MRRKPPASPTTGARNETMAISPPRWRGGGGRATRLRLMISRARKSARMTRPKRDIDPFEDVAARQERRADDEDERGDIEGEQRVAEAMRLPAVPLVVIAEQIPQRAEAAGGVGQAQGASCSRSSEFFGTGSIARRARVFGGPAWGGAAGERSSLHTERSGIIRRSSPADVQPSSCRRRWPARVREGGERGARRSTLVLFGCQIKMLIALYVNDIDPASESDRQEI